MKANFSWVAFLVTTLAAFISEPVAGSVRIAPNGMARVTFAPCFSRMVHGSSSSKAPAAMNLVPSMTEPPPTASRKSIFSALTWAIARISVS